MRALDWLAPEETAKESHWPLTLLFRPLPIAALLLLGVNDHLLKHAGILPNVVTGKLSDFAGLFFFPLLLVTLWNLLGRFMGFVGMGFRTMSSASTKQLIFSCLAVGLVFTAIQFHPIPAQLYERATELLAFWRPAGSGAVVTMDRSDVMAVPMVFASFLFGQQAIARLPPGRIRFVRAQLSEIAEEDERLDRAQSLLHDVWLANYESHRPVCTAIAAAMSRQADDDEIDLLLSRLRSF